MNKGLFKWHIKALAMVCLLNSGFLFAGNMGAVTPTIPLVLTPENDGWNIGGKALYLQPTWDYLNAPLYIRADNNVDEFPATNTQWNWGFMLEAAYRFSPARDLNLNWYHINETTTQTVNGRIVSAILTVTSPGPTIITTKPEWDAVNLEFGQHVDYGKSLAIRYHGGVEYVRLIFDRTISTAPNIPGAGNQSTYRSYGYNGFGPRAGLDASYDFKYGLSAYVKGATGLYAGTSRYVLRPTNLRLVQTTRAGSSMVVVPELEAKLGGTYTYSHAYGDLSIDAGWLWISYFNSIMDADDDRVHVANFGFQGPYLGLKWMGDLA